MNAALGVDRITLIVSRRWEVGKIDDETYWLCGADSDCSVFDEPL